MKILVTGATSLIGKGLIALLLEEGHEIRSITRQNTPPLILAKTDILRFDLVDAPNEIAAGIDTVIHIAAATPGANSSTEDYCKTNIEGTKRLISICEAEKVRRMIFISSIVVLYDDPPGGYAYSKKEAEAMICKSDLDWTILRPAEIIGADKSWKGFLQMVRNKKTVMVPGSGNQLRHPVYYRDVINAIKQVVNSSNVSRKKYTLAAAGPITYYQFLLNVKKLFNCNYKIMIVPMWLIKLLSFLNFLLPDKVKRKLTNAYGMMKNFSFDIQDAKTDFNYDPADVETTLRELKKEMSTSII